MKRILLCTNPKMNLGVEETIDYAKRLTKFVDANLEDSLKISIFIIPDFLALYNVSQLIRDSKLELAAQDCFYEDKGAFTGEVSPSVLRDIGCKYVLLGHPERIIYAKEDSEMINKKVKACIRNKLIPVVLIIEREKKLDIRETCNIMIKDLLPYFNGVDRDDINRIIIIYEPAWAIGTGSAAPVSHTYEVLASLREALDKEYGSGIGKNQLFMYGGGVTLDSAREIMELENIDGIGMGRAGLDLNFFTEAIKLAISLQRNSILKK